MEFIAVEVVRGRNELAIPLCSHARKRNLKRTDVFCGRIKKIEVCPCMENEALPISREIPCIEIIQVTMTTHVFPLGRARVNVSDSFMIREEVDALSHPAWIGYIP
jgi:hypothetical protein